MSTLVVLLRELWPAVVGTALAGVAAYLSLRGITGSRATQAAVLVELRPDRPAQPATD